MKAESEALMSTDSPGEVTSRWRPYLFDLQLFALFPRAESFGCAAVLRPAPVSLGVFLRRQLWTTRRTSQGGEGADNNDNKKTPAKHRRRVDDDDELGGNK